MDDITDEFHVFVKNANPVGWLRLSLILRNLMAFVKADRNTVSAHICTRAQSRTKPDQVPETQTLDMNWSSNSKSARDSRAQSRAQAAAERPGTQSQQLEMDADELLGELL